VGLVQQAVSTLVELLAADAAAEPAIAFGRGLTPLRNGRRAACHAPHPASALPEADTYSGPALAGQTIIERRCALKRGRSDGERV
jgi:hypothetical protein